MNLKINLHPCFELLLPFFLLLLQSHYFFHINYAGMTWTLVSLFGRTVILRFLLAFGMDLTLPLGGSMLSSGGMKVQGGLTWEARGFGWVWIVQIVEAMKGMRLLAGLVDIMTFISR